MLHIENLNVKFDNNTVIDNLTLDLQKGQIVGIVGESGSGKSMTALSIMGLLPKNAQMSGDIIFGEQKVYLNKLTEQEYRKIRGNQISMIFQDSLTAFNPSKRIGKQLVEIVQIHQKTTYRQAQNKIFELFEQVKLSPAERIFNSYPFQLSGGQRQRALIAMALANKPQLLIADEPTTALDVTVQKEIVELLLSLTKEERLSMIFISHDLALVSQIADQIAVMYKGVIVERGETKNIIYNPQNEYTKALIKCRPTLQRQKFRLPEISDLIDSNSTLHENPTLVESDISDNKIIETKGISVEYADQKREKVVKAVNNVSFQLFERETLGLVGESGCGKTTLSRTLLNLIKLSSGEIFFQNKPLQLIASKRLKFSKEIQIVYQDPYSSLNPVISIGAALHETMTIHSPVMTRKEIRLKVIDWLIKVGLDDSYYKRLPSELSGGQRQRVVIARALIPQPKILICDETVSALDVSVQARVLNLLNDLKKEFGLTYIFISHDLSVVKYMSDRIAIMQNGRIVEIGNAEDIYKNPATEYTKELIESIPKFSVVNN